MDDLDKLMTKSFKDPVVKKEYDDLEEEFKLDAQLVEMRKKGRLTQSELVKKGDIP